MVVRFGKSAVRHSLWCGTSQRAPSSRLPIGYGQRRIQHDALAHRVASTGGSQLMASPSVWWLKDFLSADECSKLIEVARPLLTPSEVFDANTASYVRDQVRTSQSAVLDRGEFQWLLSRASELLGVPPKHAETPQVARYLPGEEYQPHYDALNEDIESGRVELRRGGQRVATLCCYLTDIPKGGGGATVFPQLGLGLGNVRVTPRRGCAVLFFPACMDGHVDRRVLHGGGILRYGEKWIAQVWVRQKPWC